MKNQKSKAHQTLESAHDRGNQLDIFHACQQRQQHGQRAALLNIKDCRKKDEYNANVSPRSS